MSKLYSTFSAINKHHIKGVEVMKVKNNFLEIGKKLLAAAVILSMLAALAPRVALEASPYGGDWASGPDILQIAGDNMFGNHYAAIRADGSLWMWGANLGLGHPAGSYVPIRIDDRYDWAYVAVQSSHTVAIRTDGSLWAWGYFNHSWPSQLVPTPTRLGTEYGWASVSLCHNSALLLRRDGSLWEWHDWQNADSQSWNAQPHQVGASYDWVSAYSANGFRSGIKTDGSLWTWGHNWHGQLGDGTTVSHRHEPTQIGVDINTDYGVYTLWWQSIVTSRHNGPVVNNGFTAALAHDGSLWAWGWVDSHDHHGNPVGINNMPMRVDTDYRWVSIGVGDGPFPSLLAVKDDGTLWELRLEQRIIDGVNVTILSQPQHIPASWDGSTWTPITGITHIISPNSSSSTAFFQRYDGSIWFRGHTWQPNGHMEWREFAMLRPATNSPILGVNVDWWGSHPGGSVNVPVTLRNNPGIAAFNITITYDPEIVFPIDLDDRAIRESLGGSVFVSNIDRDAGTITAVWAAPANIYSEWLFDINFHINHHVNRTTTPISVSIEEIRCVDHELVNAYAQHGMITVFGGNLPLNVIVGRVAGQPGDTVYVPVSWHNWHNVTNAQFTFIYDGDYVTWDGDVHMVHPNDTAIANRVNVHASIYIPNSGWWWQVTSNAIQVDLNLTNSWMHNHEGTVFYISFTINDDITLDDNQTITTPVNIHDFHMTQWGNNINAHHRNGSITIFPESVSPILWGDANQDGVVDIHDLIRIAQHIARVPGMELTGDGLIAADVFFDGLINTSDLIHLAQYLASADMNVPDVILGPRRTNP